MNEVVEAKEAVRRGYADAAAGWRRWKSQFAVAGQAATAALLWTARPAAGMAVLDLASGAGEPALTLAELVGPTGHVTATDLTEEMLAVARESAIARAIGNITLRPADAECLPFADATFDLVTCRFAVMHFPDAARALREANRVLRPGGRAVFSALGPPDETPSFMTTIGVVMQYVQLPPPAPGFPGPYRFARPGKLAARFAAAGFREVREEIGVVDSPWPGPPEELWRSMPDHAPGFRDLWERLPPELRQAVEAEVLAAIKGYYDGRQINFYAPMVLVSGAR